MKAIVQPDVTRLSWVMRVYGDLGDANGAFAEYVCAPEDLVESSQLTPAIDRSYALADVPAAITYLETHHAQAKVTITI